MWTSCDSERRILIPEEERHRAHSQDRAGRGHRRPGTDRRRTSVPAAGTIEAIIPEPSDGRNGPCRADLRRHHVPESGHRLTGLAAELIKEIKSDEDQHVRIIQNIL